MRVAVPAARSQRVMAGDGHASDDLSCVSCKAQSRMADAILPGDT